VWGDPERCPKDLANGAAVRVTGTVRASPRQDQQAIELHVDTTEVIGSCPGEVYPLATKRHSLEYLREKTHLRPRTATIAAAMRIRSSLTHHVHTYFAATAFFQVHTPILTTNDCEGAGETFGVTAPAYTTPRSRAASVEPPAQCRTTTAAKTDDAAHFFGRPAHLTVSGQLHAEAMATALSRVYTFGPTFRAENSNTPRHLAEFYMLEAEVAFGGLDTAVGIAEACIQHCAEALLADESAVRDLELLWAHAEANGPTADVGAWTKAVDAPFARMTYTDAIGALADSAVEFRYPVSWGIDLKHEHEQWLARALHGGPVVITDYPAAIKPFYMRRNDGDATVACFDLLVPGVGELVGGSAREERLDVLEAAIPAGAHDALDWYVDLRRYGTVPHAGFGMGFERLIQYFTGISNIRDVIPFPRHVGTCRL
jgi:asparaginyl-tRNA synthetase